MIKLENTVTPSPKQWEAIIRGMRNPMNSWNKSDSYTTHIENPETLNTADFEFFIGDEDKKLMLKLVKAGNDHSKFMRMIPVYVDVTAPLYWWKEYDTYKVGTVANSCSTMHKIHAKKLTLDDFSHEHLTSVYLDKLEKLIDTLNGGREMFVGGDTMDDAVHKHFDYNEKNAWWQIIQLLPTSYNQQRTLMLNYAVLRNIYHSRKNHKLKEWHEFCRWIENLPYSEVITND